MEARGDLMNSSTLKLCTQCNVKKYKRDFPKRGTKVSGNICSTCKEIKRKDKGLASKEDAERFLKDMIEEGSLHQCKNCKVSKTADSFYTKRDYGKVYLNKTKCKVCQLEDVRYRTFGITNLEYDFLLQLQNYSCAICKVHIDAYSEKGYRNNFAVDHCHTTGEIRGLLCDGCNRGIGLFKEDISSLQNAIKYLSL